jgi:protein SCO1
MGFGYGSMEKTSVTRGSKQVTVTRRLLLRWVAAASVASCARGRPRGGDSGLQIPNVIVYDQTGTQRRFYDDVLRDRTYLLSFVFTSCKGRCPVTARNLSHLHRLMTPADANIRLVSVSLDPETDTPSRLLAWSRRFDNPGWTLITSSYDHIAQITQAFLGQPPSKDNHSPVALAGHDREPDLLRTSTYDDPSLLLASLRRIEAGQPRPDVP